MMLVTLTLLGTFLHSSVGCGPHSGTSKVWQSSLVSSRVSSTFSILQTVSTVCSSQVVLRTRVQTGEVISSQTGLEIISFLNPVTTLQTSLEVREQTLLVCASSEPVVDVSEEKTDLGSKSVIEEPKDEHPMFAAIKECGDDVEKVRNFFEVDGLPVDLEDSIGMTPLMHACWKGHIKLARFLIKQGADVNGGNHEHDYTTLHFASLAGKVEICKLLLQNGVKIERTNSVRRTASQMAAFVGNHECVSVINNFVPFEDVSYFTRKQPFEDEPKLKAQLARPIHNLVMSMNTHPVRVALIMKEEPILLDNVAKVCQILELMSDREFKNRRDVNEVLSLKYHILHYIVKDIKKQMEKSQKIETKSPFIDLWIKSMLVGRESDAYPVFQEDFLRQGVKEFPYPESQLFKALVTNFSHCKNYGEGVTAADYINQAFNGQKGFRDHENCETCGNENAEKKCSSCKSVQYCDQACQKYHWFVHKKICSVLKGKYEEHVKNAAAATPEVKTEN